MDDYGTLLNVLQGQASLNNAWSAEQAQKQMDFQERMSNTAHQREMADLKASGLNPILSAKLGGASTPSGASATADTSIVSSMAMLFDKMLDVADNSAKAVASASGGHSAGSVSDYSPSGKSLADQIAEDFAIGSKGFSGKEMPKIVSKVVNPDALAAAVNGFLHLDNSSNKGTDKIYQVTKTVAEQARELEKGKQELVQVAGNAIKNLVNSVLPSSAKTVSNNSIVSPKPSSSATSKAKTVVNKVKTAISGIFKK